MNAALRGSRSAAPAAPETAAAPAAAAPARAPAPRPAGGQASFEELLVPVLPRAYAAALHFTRNDADAEDLVQEAALMALRGFGTFRPGTNFRAWFLRVLTNAFLMRCRKEKRSDGGVTLDEEAEPGLRARLSDAGLAGEPDDPAREFFSRMGTERVSAAIRALPLEYRTVAGLYFAEDLSYAEIGEILGCPLGTVRSRLHRARALLQRALWDLAVEHGIVS